jgi:drug/metabolite transporter (DMT)-like permease
MQVLIPLFTVGFAVALGRERLTLRVASGIGLGLCGGLLLILPRGGFDLSSHTASGNLFLLASGVSYALYLVLARTLLARRDALVVVSWTFLAGAIVITPFGAIPEAAFLSRGATLVGWSSIVFVMIGGTTIPYLLNNWALGQVKSSVVGVYVFIQPLVGILLGHFVLREQLGSNSVAAGALILGGVAISAFRRSAAW